MDHGMLLDVDGQEVDLNLLPSTIIGRHELQILISSNIGILLHRQIYDVLGRFFNVMDNERHDDTNRTEIRVLGVTRLGVIDLLRYHGHGVCEVIKHSERPST